MFQEARLRWESFQISSIAMQERFLVSFKSLRMTVHLFITDGWVILVTFWIKVNKMQSGEHKGNSRNGADLPGLSDQPCESQVQRRRL